MAEQVSQGLTSDEAARRLAQWGPNEAVPAHRQTLFSQLFRLFANPLVLILLVASAISASLGAGDRRARSSSRWSCSASSINFWQSYRSQQAADRLRSLGDADGDRSARRRLDGVPLRTVVPGDVVRLSAGDLVPADAGCSSRGISRSSSRC